MRQEACTEHVPILFVTAVMQQPQDVFVGYEVGAVDYLLRSIDPHVLRSKVAILCDLWAQRRERCVSCLTRRTEAEFTHTICETCAEVLYPDE